ncbi:hypothetical protein KJZ61_01970 [Candidatus Dependentiae bacterium]|nr:hypothetical protein [Candidatus Dependentiae bacterium]
MKISSIITALMVCGIGSIATTTLGCSPEFFTPYQEEQKQLATPRIPETECPSDPRFIPMHQPTTQDLPQPKNNAVTTDQLTKESRENALKKINTLKELLRILRQRNGCNKNAN